MKALEPRDLETVVIRALRRVSATLLEAQEETVKANPQPDPSALNSLRQFSDASSNQESQKLTINDSLNNKESSNGYSPPPSPHGTVEGKQAAHNNATNATTSSTNAITNTTITNTTTNTTVNTIHNTTEANDDDRSRVTGNKLTTGITEGTQPTRKTHRRPNNDTGIEDMSEEEDESILDVLTKDLDQIGKDFLEGDASYKEDEALDCVSDEELPEQQQQRHSSLESIDSSDDEMEEDALLSFIGYVTANI